MKKTLIYRRRKEKNYIAIFNNFMNHRTKLFSINDLACLIAEFHGEPLKGKKHKTAYEFILWLDKLLKNERRTKKN